MSHPFKGELTPPSNPNIRATKDVFHELSDLKDKIIREHRLDPKRKKDVSDFKSAREYFYRLRDEYGIAIPNIDLVLGNDSKSGNERKVYMVVDEILGRNFKDADFKSEEFKVECVDFVSKLTKVFCDDVAVRKPLWWDLGAAQLVYGHRKSETVDRIYIVDVEPRLSFEEKVYPAAALINLARFIEYLEIKFKDKLFLQSCREKLGKAGLDFKYD